MKKIIFSLFLILSLAAPCFAVNWYWIGTSSTNEYNYYIDNDSVQKNMQYAVVWVKITNPDASFTMDKIALSHDNRTYIITNSFDYNSDGSLINSYDFSYRRGHWNTIAPGSMIESVFYSVWNY